MPNTLRTTGWRPTHREDPEGAGYRKTATIGSVGGNVDPRMPHNVPPHVDGGSGGVATVFSRTDPAQQQVSPAQQARASLGATTQGTAPQSRLAPMVNEQTYPDAGGGRSQAAAGYSKQFTTDPGRDAWGKNFDEAFQRKYDLMERGQDMGFDTSARGQDHDMFRHADDHGLKTQMHELTGRMHDENLGFKQDQHKDTHGLARDNLNQQGKQWQSTFDRQGERLGIEDTRYDQEGYDKRQQREITNEEARRRLELDEGKAMTPRIATTYDEHGQRQSTEVPGLVRGPDGRLVPPQAPQLPGLDLDSLTDDQMELQRKQLRRLLGLDE